MTPVALAVAAAERLVHDAGLEPVALPEDLASGDGVYRGSAVRLRAEAWRSQRIPWARRVCVEGERMSIGNVLAVAHPSLGLPILGVDVVRVRDDEVLVATDLVPMRAEPLSPSAPDWARDWFSARARVVRVAPDALRAEQASVDALVAEFVARVRDAVVDAAATDEVRARQREYLRVHRTDDPGMRLLPTVFGEAWAARFLAGVLFPEPTW